MTVKTKRARLLALTEEGISCHCFTVGKIYTGKLDTYTRLMHVTDDNGNDQTIVLDGNCVFGEWQLTNEKQIHFLSFQVLTSANKSVIIIKCIESKWVLAGVNPSSYSNHTRKRGRPQGGRALYLTYPAFTLTVIFRNCFPSLIVSFYFPYCFIKIVS